MQGDVSDEIFDFITEDSFFEAVPEDNIDCIEGIDTPESATTTPLTKSLEKRKSVK